MTESTTGLQNNEETPSTRERDFVLTMTGANHYRSFDERLPMVNFTITESEGRSIHGHR